MTEQLSLILCTCPGTHAQELAEKLVNSGRAACVNILPHLRSIYRWQGQLHNDEESLLIVKSAYPDMTELFAWLADQHPYDVPEIVRLDSEQTLPSYLQWAIEHSGKPQ